MPSYNHVALVGNVTRDIELKYLRSGMAVCEIGLAVNERRKQGDQYVDEPVFVDITLWGKTAELAAQYVAKGDPVLIEGRLKLDAWTDKDGAKRSKLKVTGERLVFLKGRSDQEPPTDYEYKSATVADENPF